MTILAGMLGLVQAQKREFDIPEMILHHLSDSHYWDVAGREIHLPEFPPVQVGPLTIDFSITKHVLFMMIAAVLVMIVLIPAGRKARKEHETGAHRGPKGGTNVVEAMVLYLRDEVAIANIGHGGERFAPYVVAVFFFVLFCNLLGLLPWGSTPTGNITVTGTLAAITFVIVEVAGMRALGPAGYARTIFYAPEGLHGLMRLPMYLIMTPIEFLGKLTKPFALAIRLYANMTAGHAVVLALTGLLVVAGAANVLWLAPAPVIMAVAIMLLEIFVAFLQAYIFAMLSAVFIGLIRNAH